MKSTVEVVDLTKKLAEELIEVIPEYQRKPSLPHVVDLTADMDEGRWQLTSNGIGVVVDSKGQPKELVNGMHRVMARLESKTRSKVPVVLLKMPGSSNEYGVVDQGKPRSLADQLNVLGVPFINEHATLVTRLFKYVHGVQANSAAPNRPSGSRSKAASISARVAFFLDEMDHAITHEAILVAQKAYRACSAPKGDIAVFFYLSRIHNLEAEADAFLEAVIKGDTPPGDPARTYRDATMLWRTAIHKTPGRIRWEILLKAWHKHLAGEQVKVLGFNKNEPHQSFVPAWLDVNE